MRVVCNQCSHEHTIPDENIRNKKVYFYCKNCAHKIVIAGQADHYETFNTPTVSTRPILTIEHIFDAVPRFFNINSFLISFLFFIFTLIAGATTALVITNQSIASDYPVIIFICLALSVLILLYVYSFILYTISKIHYYKLSNPSSKHIDWKYVFFDIKEDALVLFIFSSGIQFLALLLLIPVYFLHEYGVTYSSVLFIPILMCVLFVIITAILHDFIPSIIAIPSLSISQHFCYVLRYLRREIINLPIYIVSIAVIGGIVSGIITALVSGAVLFSFSAIAFLSGISFKSTVAQIIPSIVQVFSSSNSKSSVVPDYLSVSMIILAIFIFLIIISLISLLFNLRIALVAQSCWIMNETPEHSVPRKTLFAGMGFFIGALIITGIIIIIKAFTHLI